MQQSNPNKEKFIIMKKQLIFKFGELSKITLHEVRFTLHTSAATQYNLSLLYSMLEIKRVASWKIVSNLGVPFTFSHLPCQFFQLLALSTGVFDLVQLLETIATRKYIVTCHHKHHKQRELNKESHEHDLPPPPNNEKAYISNSPLSLQNAIFSQEN